jgi:hypothetical protein
LKKNSPIWNRIDINKTNSKIARSKYGSILRSVLIFGSTVKYLYLVKYYFIRYGYFTVMFILKFHKHAQSYFIKFMLNILIWKKK